MICLVNVFKHIFFIFKQHYIYFYILFYLYVFSKNTNNITKIILPKGFSLNTYFLFLNNITYISIYFFTYIYFQKI